MGSRGPVGKRKQELNGHRSKDELAGKTVSSIPGAVNVAIPEPDPGWHPIASALWRAASVSGQSAFYEPSDWAVLFSLMDDLSAYKRKAVRSGQMLQTIMSSLSSLLLTEGDRRRLQIELTRPSADTGEDAGVAEMNKWRQKLRS